MRTKYLIPILLAGLIMGCASNRPGQQEQAREKWNQARASVLLALAQDQYRTGHFDRSRSTIDEALRLDPANVSLHLLSAKLSIEEGQLELAERQLRLVRELDEDNAEADYLTGVIFQRWQQPETAYEFYTRAADKAPAELAYLLAQSEMLVVMERPEEALALLQARVIYFEHSAAIRDAVGQLLMQQGRYSEAVAMFRQASHLASDDPSMRENLALAMYHAKQYRDSADVLTRLLQDERYVRRADLRAALGECLMHQGRVQEGRVHLDAAVRLDPQSSTIWLSVARASIRLNDLRRTEMALHRSLSLDASDSEAHLLTGYLRLRQNRLNEALGAFRRADNLGGADPVTLCMIGYVLEKMGRSDEAVRYYGQALKLSPNDELAMKLMAGANWHD